MAIKKAGYGKSTGRSHEKKGRPAAVSGPLKKYRALIEILPVPAMIIDSDGIIRIANIHASTLHGYSSPAEIEGIKGLGLLAADERASSAESIRRIGQSRYHHSGHTLLRKNGSSFHAEVDLSPMFDRKGNRICYLSISHDISDRTKIDAALRESEERHRIISELSTDYMFKYDVGKDGRLRLVYMTENLKSLTGRSPDEIASSDQWGGIVHQDDEEAFQTFRKNLVMSGEPGEIECRTFNKNGTMRWIHIFTKPLRAQEGGTVTSIIGAIKDITDRKTAEAKLSETQGRLEYILGVTRTGVDIIDAGFGVRYVDPEWQKKYGPLEGKKCYEYFMGRDTMCSTCGVPRALETKLVTVTEEVLPHENNRVIEVHTIPFQSHDGEWMVAEFNLDITERKKAEDRIRASLTEKETLLKEIHHRVKNNMQIITSLLSLQSRYFTDTELVRQFTEAQNRIRSMSLVHETLYQSKDFGHINLRSYIMQLAHEVMSSYSAMTARINLRLEIEDTDISIDHAIPCGLIINELITNSIKHAFPAGWAGTPEISVSFRNEDDGSAELAIGDNGMGIPGSTIPGKTGTLGLVLVPMLAEQIKGEAVLDRSAGTRFTIRFKP